MLELLIIIDNVDIIRLIIFIYRNILIYMLLVDEIENIIKINFYLFLKKMCVESY